MLVMLREEGMMGGGYMREMGVDDGTCRHMAPVSACADMYAQMESKIYGKQLLKICHLATLHH